MRSINDPYYSYRRRCILNNKPYMSLSQFKLSRKNGPKRKNGSFKPVWNRKNKRPLLIWLSIYDNEEKLIERKTFLNKKLNSNISSSNKSMIKKQIKKINLALNLFKLSWNI